MSYPYKAIKVNGKKIDEHRYIMQTHLKRKLKRNEVIHHINGNKKDNRLENLELQLLSVHTHNFMNNNKNIRRWNKGLQWNKCLWHNKGLYRLKDGMYWCSRCKKYLPISEFWKKKYDKYGIREYCKKCFSKYNKEHVKKINKR